MLFYFILFLVFLTYFDYIKIVFKLINSILNINYRITVNILNSFIYRYFHMFLKFIVYVAFF
ncbi:hypothetical protein H8356DRAFT_1674040 [Neocallimastix lanati (nom. inval.)]|nr:hypothetical protein H8356DRAFT_1674040 [Neocallimastix sp. JGI-2020a]